MIERPYNDYASFLDSEIQQQWKLQDSLEKKLAKKINISSVKENQTQLLKAYYDDWNKSWRSWRLFKDDTREGHMKTLQNRINNLNISGLIDYLQYLENAIKYANSKNGDKYADVINEMRSNFMGYFDKEARQLLLSILHIEVDTRRLRSKDNGHEEYDRNLANLSRYFK